MILPTGVLLKSIFGWDDLVIFLENTTSWACLLRSGLKDIFHLKAHSDIFCRSLFSSFAEMLLSFTTENSDVSSAKSFTVDINLSRKSLI